MNNYYLRFRVFLMAFAFGLASFWFFDGMLNGVLESHVDLPEAESDEILIVLPRYDCEISFFQSGGGGASGGEWKPEYRIEGEDKSPEMIIKECIEDFSSRGITYKAFR